MKQIIDLGGRWTLFDTLEPEHRIEAQVPGCVHLDLRRADRLPDLFWGDQERDNHAPFARDWCYRRRFEVAPEVLRATSVRLIAQGLDTLAEVRVNGEVVLTANNMFRLWSAEVRPVLQAGDNLIEVRFRSPLQTMAEGEARQKQHAWNLFDERYRGASYIRKMGCAFGWDWGPMAPSAGIYKPIFLEVIDRVSFDDVRVSQHHDEQVTLRIDASASEGEVRATLRLQEQLRSEGRATVTAGRASLSLEVPNPALWWPNGLGLQPLYELNVELWTQQRCVDRRTFRIGLRTLELVTAPDAQGSRFHFRVNGRDFFAKGANWIPADIFVSSVQESDYARLLKDAQLANMNMLRCWGGGIYESDVFYDRCDELGLLVWQDFMFACATYPTNEPGFVSSVEAEAKDQVRRLRHHACLALWCGNNELEQGLVGESRTDYQMDWTSYRALFDERLAQVVQQEHPDGVYWPSSPHTPGAGREDANDPRAGDAHPWDVWHGGEPIEHQRGYQHRFLSEFGFQSFPELRTVARFASPSERNLSSYVMDFHQRSKDRGNKTILNYLLSHFRLPSRFDELLWATQVVAAKSVQVALETARQRQPQTMGALYWQLNDLWPAPTWSSIDVFGRWKALHYVVRRSFANRLISGVVSPSGNAVLVYVSNQAIGSFFGTARYRVTSASGESLLEGSREVRLDAQQARPVIRIDCEQALQTRGARDLLVWLWLEQNGEKVSRNLVTFGPEKHLKLVDPKLQAKVDGGKITVWAQAPALWVRLELSKDDATFEDNFFHLQPGEQRDLALLRGPQLDDVALLGALRLRTCFEASRP